MIANGPGADVLNGNVRYADQYLGPPIVHVGEPGMTPQDPLWLASIALAENLGTRVGLSALPLIGVSYPESKAPLLQALRRIAHIESLDRASAYRLPDGRVVREHDASVPAPCGPLICSVADPTDVNKRLFLDNLCEMTFRIHCAGYYGFALEATTGWTRLDGLTAPPVYDGRTPQKIEGLLRVWIDCAPPSTSSIAAVTTFVGQGGSESSVNPGLIPYLYPPTQLRRPIPPF